MKKLMFASFLAVSLCSFTAFAEQLTGYISDSHCGTTHSSPSAANTQCIKKCLKGGSDAVLVSEGKVMKFDPASAKKAAAHAGQNVTIDGTVTDNVVQISSIKRAK